ncbi:hypothetical protein TNCV_2145171 [Trichonephila clavipes]|nr:hypothetical protein TNCV_2145171 [Trichonephila clavipes]
MATAYLNHRYVPKKEASIRCCQELIIARASEARSQAAHIVLSAKKNRRTTAQQVTNRSSLLPQQISKSCCQTFEGVRTIRTQTCCGVCPIDQTAPYCPFAMMSSITIRLVTTGACVPFSDERGSVCRRIVDAKPIWRESGTSTKFIVQKNIQEKDRYPTCVSWCESAS